MWLHGYLLHSCLMRNNERIGGDMKCPKCPNFSAGYCKKFYRIVRKKGRYYKPEECEEKDDKKTKNWVVKIIDESLKKPCFSEFTKEDQASKFIKNHNSYKGRKAFLINSDEQESEFTPIINFNK